MAKNKDNIRIVLLTVAIVLLIAGLATDGFSEVRTKAITICMECIGIG